MHAPLLVAGLRGGSTALGTTTDEAASLAGWASTQPTRLKNSKVVAQKEVTLKINIDRKGRTTAPAIEGIKQIPPEDLPKIVRQE